MDAANITPFIRHKSTGCGDKCPCRAWLQCNKYLDKPAQEWRLKHKQTEQEILDYYQQHFSGSWHMHGLYVSG